MTRVLKLITFDVTGTLMTLQPPVAVKYAECAKKFGIMVNSDDIIPHFKVQWKELSKIHPNFGKQTGLGWRAWWTQIVTKTFKSAVPSSDDKALEQLAAILIEEYKSTRCWAMADGALDILNYLKGKNITIGVISNFDERLETILKSVQIHSYFNFILTSYAAGVMKPDKKIFDMARNQTEGDISPDYCAHIGNSIDFDYEGAKNAGWKPLYIGAVDKNVLDKTSNCNVFENLTQLKQYFEVQLDS